MNKQLTTSICGFFFCISLLSAQSLSIIKDIQPGSGGGVSSYGQDYATAGSKIYFAGTATGFPVELFVSDGTAAGTKKAGTVSAASPEMFLAAGARVFFKAYGSNGDALFVTNSAASGAASIKTFSGPYLEGILPFDNAKVLLAVNDGTSNKPKELWVSTTSAASKIADIDLNPEYMVHSRFGNNSVYYERSTNFEQMEPFMTNGTAAGTQKIIDWIQPITPFAKVTAAYSTGDLMFLSGYTISNGFQYSKRVATDGTAAGTQEIDFFGDISRVIKRDSASYFLIGNEDIALYNPIAQKTTLLKSNVDYFGVQMLLKNKVYYHVTGGIWETDGTVAGTKNLNVTPLGNSFYSPQMLAQDSVLYYTVRSATALELWAKNLQSGANTRLTDIFANSGLIVEPFLTILNDKLVFTKYTTEQGYELWSYGKTSSGTFDLVRVAVPLSLYPNPAVDHFVMDLDASTLGGNLTITDMLGKTVLNLEQVHSNHISLTGLNEGLYVVRYQQDDITRVATLRVLQK